MKDIKSIYKSESYKKEKYSVELQDDNVYEWRVALVSFIKKKLTVNVCLARGRPRVEIGERYERVQSFEN